MGKGYPVERLDKVAPTNRECDMHAVSARRRVAVERCFDAEQDAGHAVIGRVLAALEQPQAEAAKDTVIEFAGAGDIVRADGDVVDHRRAPSGAASTS